jgi:hypothetical protein
LANPLFGRLFLRRGSVIGTEHRRLGINNQDFVGTGLITLPDGQQFALGVVCDGCTVRHARGASRNEVGASLLGNYVLCELELLLRSSVPMQELLSSLYFRCVSYLGMISRFSVTGDAERTWAFIEKHLLATIVGVIASEEQILLFRAGDGVIIVNDEVHIIDEGGAPLYPAYHLVDRRILEKSAPGLVLPQGFQWAEYPASQVRRVCVATDGLADISDPKSIRPEDLAGIFEHEKEAPAGLQWYLNHRTNFGQGFKDDCSAVVLTE